MFWRKSWLTHIVLALLISKHINYCNGQVNDVIIVMCDVHYMHEAYFNFIQQA